GVVFVTAIIIAAIMVHQHVASASSIIRQQTVHEPHPLRHVSPPPLVHAHESHQQQHSYQCMHNDDQMIADMYHHGMDRDNYKNVHLSSFTSHQRISSHGRSFETEATGFSNIRIVLRTVDVENITKVCTVVGQVISDMEGSTATCTADDILTTAKKEILLNQVLPQAIALLNARLKVDPVVRNLVVGSTSACSFHTIPTVDTSTGISNADFVLYVSAAPTHDPTIAWASYCELDATNKRPLVGRSNFGPKYLTNSSALELRTVIRTGVHEIMHALGFSKQYVSNHNPSIFGNISTRGKNVFAINGSATVAAGRSFFNCSSLTAVELEDEGGSGTQYSHWERRNHYEDVMAGVVGDFMYISNLTLSYFHDLGVYQADFSYAETPLWGQRQGCSLLNESCMSTSNPGLGWMFCNDTQKKSNLCLYNYVGYSTCYVKNSTTPIPSYFQYFPSMPSLGGADSVVDYCPNVILGRRCSDNTTADDPYFGYHYGVGTRCLPVNNVILNGYTASSYPGAICTSVRCVDGVRIQFQLNNSAWIDCPADGSAGVVSAPAGYKGTISCPLAYRMCKGADDIFINSSMLATTAPPTTTTTLASTLPPTTTVGLTTSTSTVVSPTTAAPTTTASPPTTAPVTPASVVTTVAPKSTTAPLASTTTGAPTIVTTMPPTTVAPTTSSGPTTTTTFAPTVTTTTTTHAAASTRTTTATTPTPITTTLTTTRATLASTQPPTTTVGLATSSTTVTTAAPTTVAPIPSTTTHASSTTTSAPPATTGMPPPTATRAPTTATTTITVTSAPTTTTTTSVTTTSVPSTQVATPTTTATPRSSAPATGNVTLIAVSLRISGASWANALEKNYSGVISSVVADIAAKLNITNFPGSISALVAVQTSSAGLMIYANVSVSALVAGNVVRSADVTSPSVMSQNVSDGLSVLPLPRLAGVYSSSTSATDTIALAEPAAVSALTAAVVVPQPPTTSSTAAPLGATTNAATPTTTTNDSSPACGDLCIGLVAGLGGTAIVTAVVVMAVCYRKPPADSKQQPTTAVIDAPKEIKQQQRQPSGSQQPHVAEEKHLASSPPPQVMLQQKDSTNTQSAPSPTSVTASVSLQGPPTQHSAVQQQNQPQLHNNSANSMSILNDDDEVSLFISDVDHLIDLGDVDLAANSVVTTGGRYDPFSTDGQDTFQIVL
ncbi:major surface protease, GP63, putative, partial [Bodo saltans]